MQYYIKKNCVFGKLINYKISSEQIGIWYGNKTNEEY